MQFFCNRNRFFLLLWRSIRLLCLDREWVSTDLKIMYQIEKNYRHVICIIFYIFLRLLVLSWFFPQLECDFERNPGQVNEIEYYLNLSLTRLSAIFTHLCKLYQKVQFKKFLQNILLFLETIFFFFLECLLVCCSMINNFILGFSFPLLRIISNTSAHIV